MPIRYLKGPCPLQASEINSLESTSGPAVYVLGNLMPDGSIIVSRLGLTAVDLKTHLERYIGRYTHFWSHECPTIAEAFVLACELYHAYLPQDNIGHPMVNTREAFSCPHCGFDTSLVQTKEHNRN